MEIKDLQKYIGKKILLVLRNDFKYKFVLERDNIKEKTLSFIDFYNNPVDVNIDEISIITVSRESE